jgi:hypothetical protein
MLADLAQQGLLKLQPMNKSQGMSQWVPFMVVIVQLMEPKERTLAHDVDRYHPARLPVSRTDTYLGAGLAEWISGSCFL